MFFIERRLATNDVDLLGCARPSALMKMMHAAANEQMLAEGASNAQLVEEGLVFILSATAMRISRPAFENEILRVYSWPCVSRGFTFLRGYRAVRGDETIAECVTRWALVDGATKKLLPVAAADTSRYTFGEAPALGFNGKIAFPADLAWEKAGERTVLWSDIDYNAHMNNAVYLDMLADFVPSMEQLAATDVAIRWHAGAPFGGTIRVERAQNAGAWYFKTSCENAPNVEARLALRKA